MQTAESMICRTAANICRTKAKRSMNPRAWLDIADDWDALAKAREEGPTFAPRPESLVGRGFPMGALMREMEVRLHSTADG